MKKILKTLGIVIGLILLLIILLPIFFKGKIFDMIMEEANKNLTAKVEIQDLSLSLIRNFPDFTLTLDGTSVTGTEEFEGVKLADIERIRASLDIMSVISGDEIKINSFGITGADIHTVITKDGKPNWDIVKATEAGETPEEEPAAEGEEGGPLDISIKEYFIRNANVIYDDREFNTYLEINNLTHEGSGNFDLEEFVLNTTTNIEALTYKMDGTAFMKDVEIELLADLGINLTEDKYTFMDNTLRMNTFSMSFDGWFQMLSLEEYDMDLTFGTENTEFKSLLSLVPNAFTEDFDDVQAEGSLQFNGTAKGNYKFETEDTDMVIPAFALDLKVPHAGIQYPDLPESIDNIEIDFHTENPGGSVDNTVVDLRSFYMELAKNPIDIRFFLKTPISDPDIKAGMHAQIDMESLKNAMPVEDEEMYTGRITADFDVAGKMSSIEEERYQDFKAEGKLIIMDFLYESLDFDYPIELKKMYMNFSPQFVDLSTFEAQAGKTDISADGRIDNILAYVLQDQTLTGTFNVRSEYMNLNEFMVEPEEGVDEDAGSEGSDSEEAELTVFEVPEKIDFTMTADFKEVLWDNLTITDIKGGLRIYDQTVDMSNLNMNMLDGSLAMNGSYNTHNPKRPKIDFGLDMKQFDIQKTGTTFNTVESMAPIVESATGKFSAKFNMAGELLENMDADLNSLKGGGTLKTHKVVVDNETLEKIDNAVKTDKFNPLHINDVNIKFTFADGRVTTEPFSFTTGGIKNTVSGYTTFEQQMDYLIESEVPSSILGGDVNKLAGSILSGLKDRGIDAGESLPEIIKVKFAVTGDVNDPDVKPTFGGGEGGKSLKDKAVDKAKERAKEEVEKKKEEVREKAKEEAEKIIADAQKRADQIVAEAEEQADKVRLEGKNAADKIREEADKRGQQLIDEASNPISKKAAEKSAEKLKKEAEEKAKKTENEADNRADDIERKAQERADQIMKEAREKADDI